MSSSSPHRSIRRHEGLRRSFGEMFLALFLAMAPSTVPDWRADPSLRIVAVMPIGEPTPKLRAGLPHRGDLPDPRV